VGQGAREEINVAPAGTPAGINYGWVCMEGSIQNSGASPTCNPSGDVLPVLEKDHDPAPGGDGYRAIIGGYVVRDPALTGLTGRYLYTDLVVTELRSAAPADWTDDVGTGVSVPGSVTSFGEDSCGHLYVSSTNGTVYRIDDASFTPCPESPPPGPGDPGPGPPGGGDPPAGGDPPPVGDTRAPELFLTALRRQPALRLRGFRLGMSCDEACTALAAGRVRVAGSRRVYVLAPATRALAAGRRVKLTLRASRRARRAIRRALASGRAVRATLTVTGTDAAGNAATGVRRVRARP
jgi:hypothetical protein